MDNLHDLILIGVGVMILLALGIIFFVILYQRRMLRHQAELRILNEQKQRELLQASIHGEEQERMRIASELHDDVGATLSSIRLFLHTAARTSDTRMIDQSRELLDNSIQKIREISHKLQPSTLQHLGLKASLESLAEVVNRTGSIRMDHDLSALPQFDDECGLALYRVMQELLANIIKHSQSTTITLCAERRSNVVVLVLYHNGAGLTDETYQQLIYKKGAIGLKNIVNRIRSIQASIHFQHVSDGLYRVNIIIPYKQ